MKKETKIYESPLLDVVFLKTEGVLCGSSDGISDFGSEDVNDDSDNW